MTLTTATPSPTRVTSPGPPRRPSRLRHLLAGVVAVLALMALAGYLAAPQLVWLGSSGAPEVSGDAGVSLPTFESGTTVLVYDHGARFTVTTSVTNRGLLPATVTGARLTDEPRPLVETTGISLAGAEPPVTLGPGDTVELVLRSRFGNCRYYHEREAQLVPSVLVEGEVLGREYTRTVEFAQKLVARSPMIVDCPDRTLSRDDDARR